MTSPKVLSSSSYPPPAVPLTFLHTRIPSRLPMESPGREVVLGDWLARKTTSQARLRLGLAVTNLDVHGSASAASFQPTVASYALAIPRLASSLLSRRPDQRVQILHAIDGFIKSGEMLLVLGRPGSACTTLLKALAGDDHGIFIHDESSINSGTTLGTWPCLSFSTSWRRLGSIGSPGSRGSEGNNMQCPSGRTTPDESKSSLLPSITHILSNNRKEILRRKIKHKGPIISLGWKSDFGFGKWQDWPWVIF